MVEKQRKKKVRKIGEECGAEKLLTKIPPLLFLSLFWHCSPTNLKLPWSQRFSFFFPITEVKTPPLWSKGGSEDMHINVFQLQKSIANKFVSKLCKKVASYHANYNLIITSVRHQLFWSNKRLKLKLS